MMVLAYHSGPDPIAVVIGFFIVAGFLFAIGMAAKATSEASKKPDEVADSNKTKPATSGPRTRPTPQTTENPMNVDAKQLPQLQGPQRFFQMPDGGLIIFSKPGSKQACSDSEVFEYFNIARTFLNNGSDRYVSEQLRQVRKQMEGFRSITLPDGSEVMVRLPDRQKPSMEDAGDLLDFAHHLLKMQQAREEAKAAPKPQKKSDAARKAFDVESPSSKVAGNGALAKG